MCLLALLIYTRPEDLCSHANGIGILGANVTHSKDEGPQCEEGGEPHLFIFMNKSLFEYEPKMSTP